MSFTLTAAGPPGSGKGIALRRITNALRACGYTVDDKTGPEYQIIVTRDHGLMTDSHVSHGVTELEDMNG